MGPGSTFWGDQKVMKDDMVAQRDEVKGRPIHTLENSYNSYNFVCFISLKKATLEFYSLWVPLFISHCSPASKSAPRQMRGLRVPRQYGVSVLTSSF